MSGPSSGHTADTSEWETLNVKWTLCLKGGPKPTSEKTFNIYEH